MSIKDMWKYLMFQTKGYRIIEAVIVIGSLCGAAVAYVNSILYAKIIDKLMLKNYNGAISLVFIMVLSIWLINMVYQACNQVFRQYADPSRDETRKRTARKTFKMEYEEFEKEDTLLAFRRIQNGEISSGSVSDQLYNIYYFFERLVKIVFDLEFLIILVVQAALGSRGNILEIVLMTAILIALFGLSFWINFIISQKINERNVMINRINEKSNAEGMYMATVIANESNAKDFRLYGLQDYWLGKSKNGKIGRSFTEYGIFVGRNRAKFSFAVQLLAGYIYIYVSVMAMSGSISTGDVLMYAGAIITMMTSVQDAILKYNEIAYNNEYLKLYEEFIKRPNMHYDGTLPIEKRDDKRYELSFYNVSFKYPGSDKYILKDINMTFNIGEKLALVGLNGAGKTTLIKLLLRLYEPTKGEIRLNGIDIGKYDYDEYVQIFSVVFQDFGIFDFPLDENIAASEDVDSARVKKVIDKVGLTELVNSLPDKEHTLLYHENGDGVALSGGEAQKLAIARALYKDAPFVILDEPTAALDPIAEAEIYENFDTLVGDKTAIYISHRMSSCKFCDRIVVINNGRIEEEGSHDTLMEKNGLYAKMYNTQANYYV
mgnify:FL=1